MHPSVPTTPMLTFVLRFWRETTAGEERWRGRIEHVQSGESIAFLDIDALLRFLRRFGITLETNISLPAKKPDISIHTDGE